MKILPVVKNTTFSPLVLFSLIIFFVSLNDGIISYITPVILNDRYNDTLIVGSILSISSFFGIFFNLFVSKFFPYKNYKFFVSWMLLFAILTPISLMILPKALVPFIFIMIIWSIYYEFRNYSKYDFVNRFLPSKMNAEAWSVMTTFQSTAYMLGPVIAFLLINKSASSVLQGTLVIITIAVFSFLIFLQRFKKRQGKIIHHHGIRSLFKEVKIIHILASKIWPLALFTIALTLLDVSFWTMGVLYSEELRSQNEIGGLLLTVYCLPAMVVGFITPKIYGAFGKKRTAFIAGLLAGLGLLVIGSLENVYLILVTVFFTSAFSNIAFILIFATFEDYVTRLDGEGNNLVSINQISQNFAYASGPFLLGLISQGGNFGLSFTVTGGILMFFSLLALILVPRKVKMPHKALAMELAKELFK